MADLKGFIPHLFMNKFSDSGRKPFWFVMLLGAMTSATIWVAAWLAVALFAETSLPGRTVAENALGFAFLWSEATVWFHLAYMFQVRTGWDGPFTKNSYEIWVTPIGMLILFFIKVGWLFCKFALAPLIPFVLLSEMSRTPGVNAVLLDIICVLFLLYPVIGVAAYLIQRRHSAPQIHEAEGRN